MPFRARCVVTGHDGDGRAVVISDEAQPTTSPAEGYEVVRVWATDSLPVRNDAVSADNAGQASGKTRTDLYIGELAPGHHSVMHRTHTLDYGILLEGECELHLDGGEIVQLRTGDVVVQRGTNHAWVNVSSKPARLAFVLIDAAPITIGGVELPDTLPFGREVGGNSDPLSAHT